MAFFTLLLGLCHETLLQFTFTVHDDAFDHEANTDAQLPTDSRDAGKITWDPQIILAVCMT
jgi:hypothetical protein